MSAGLGCGIFNRVLSTLVVTVSICLTGRGSAPKSQTEQPANTSNILILTIVWISDDWTLAINL